MAALLKQRVVVTGVGVVTPLGVGLEETWSNILKGKSGVVSLKDESFVEGIDIKIGGKLPPNYDAEKYQTKYPNKVFNLAKCVSQQAVNDSAIDFKKVNLDRAGACIGHYNAMMNAIKQNQRKSYKEQLHLVPCMVSNMYNLQGYLNAATYACATSTISIGNAYKQIKHGYQDVILAGGVDLNMHRFIYEGVQLLGIGAGGFNDCPEKACMPFDKKRQGGVNAEGGGMLVIESLEHALARKAPKIYCEIVGFHQNADVDHASVPRQTNLFKAQKQAMIEAGITPSMLDMLSSHAASTIIGDQAEATSIKGMLGNKEIWDDFDRFASSDPTEVMKMNDLQLQNIKKCPVLAFKGNLGHTGCGSGAIETILSIKSMHEQILPKILNLTEPCDDELNFVLENTPKKVKYILKQGMGFGIVNAALVLKAYDE